MKKIVYSQIVRCKLKTLKIRLTSEFGLEVSRRALKRITKAVRGLYVQVVWSKYGDAGID